MNSDEPTIRNIICTVRANPKPDTVYLYKNDQNKAYAKQESTIEDENNPILNKYIRVFQVNGEKDYGEYVCISKNEHGENMKSHNVTMERPAPQPPVIPDYPANGVYSSNQELRWKLNSDFEIIKFEVTVSKIIQATPGTSKTLLHLTEIKPKKAENENVYFGTYPLDEIESESHYHILIKATNAYDKSSEKAVQIYLQKSSSSSANQSLICIFLILAVCLTHFRTIRLH